MTEPTTLKIFTGADGGYTLYEDDGISQDYVKRRGSWTRITWNEATRQLTIEPGTPAGATNVVTTRVFRVQLVPDGTAREVSYSGTRVQVKM